jgi:hypothetical protein
MKSRCIHSPLMFTVACLFISQLQAQDLEPRLLSPMPTGGNFAVASYGYSVGNILLDEAAPIDDLNARLNFMVLAYSRSFKLFNKLGKVDVIVPYAFGNFDAIVNSVDTSASRHGFGDPMIRLSMILVGTGAMNPTDFLNRVPKKFNLGTSIRVRAPLGQYNPEYLVNLGVNRWALKLTLSASYTIRRRVVFEGHLNGGFFSENSNFNNGNTLQQKPMLSGQLHVIYVIKPGIWAAGSIGNALLGETKLNGVEQENLNNTSRYGLAFAFRLNKHSALKLGFTSGLTALYGADFTTLALAYQFIWFDKSK